MGTKDYHTIILGVLQASLNLAENRLNTSNTSSQERLGWQEGVVSGLQQAIRIVEDSEFLV